MIQNLSNYAIYLIRDIKQFARIKSIEKIKLVPTEINLREIVNFGYDILISLLRCNKSKEESIQPELEFDENIDTLNIKGDETRLRHIILNILSNAVKFTKSGFIKIKCSVVTLKEIVVVCISDSGVGIQDNEQGKLFTDFQKINNANFNNSMGNGLGLSICKSLALSMDIQMSASSIYGVGTEFSLAIPYKPEFVLNNLDVNQHENDLAREILNQEMRIINSQRLLDPQLSSKFGLNLKNKNRKNDHQKKISQTSRIKSKHSSTTVKQGIDDTIPKLNNIDTSLNNNIHGPTRTNVTGQDINMPRVISESSRSIEIIERKKRKILIADDNYFNCEATKNILKEILKESGKEMEIIMCSDGVDIIYQLIHDQSRGNEIKCIISNENLEFIDASEAISIIRNLRKSHKIKFVNLISITGNDESRNTNEIIKAGAQLVLNKPLQKTGLVCALKELNII